VLAGSRSLLTVSHGETSLGQVHRVYEILLMIGSPVLIEQIPENLSSRASAPAVMEEVAPADPAETGIAGVRRTADGRLAVSLALIRACQDEAAGQSIIENVDCARILQLVEAETRRTAEASLLDLLPGSVDVTRGGPSRTTSTTDADTVARELSTGAPVGDAAAIAARQRLGPTAPPR
jgi:hypothetical protein